MNSPDWFRLTSCEVTPDRTGMFTAIWTCYGKLAPGRRVVFGIERGTDKLEIDAVADAGVCAPLPDGVADAWLICNGLLIVVVTPELGARLVGGTGYLRFSSSPRTTLSAPPLRTFTELGYHPAGELTLEEAQQLAGTLAWQVMAAVAGDTVPFVPARRDVTSADEVTAVGSFFRYTGHVIDGQGHVRLEEVVDPVDTDEDVDCCDGWCDETQCFLFEEDDDD